MFLNFLLKFQAIIRFKFYDLYDLSPHPYQDNLIVNLFLLHHDLVSFFLNVFSWQYHNICIFLTQIYFVYQKSFKLRFKTGF